MRDKRVAASRLAGFGAAQLEDVPAGRRAAEIVIEADDAVDLGAGDIESLGDQRLGGFVDIAEFLLQSVQDRQQRTFAVEAAPNPLQRHFFVPRHLKGNLALFHRHKRRRLKDAVRRLRSFANHTPKLCIL